MFYILLAPGFEEMEALVPADLLRRAGVEVALVGVSGEFIPGGHNITVKSDLPLSEVKLEDMEGVMLPGGGVGVANLGAEPRVEELVRQAAAQDKLVSAICAAPSLLSKWGLLAGKRAVCYPSWKDKIADACYLPGEKLAREGGIVTGQAAGASFEFGLKLIEVLRGEETARRVREEICL